MKKNPITRTLYVLKKHRACKEKFIFIYKKIFFIYKKTHAAAQARHNRRDLYMNRLMHMCDIDMSRVSHMSHES